ncbi:unnamed protein product [Pedinophyceae sp. YPF-701]|nr:unnamed protein product [Pedinophyceae sp. YPF-701]
MADVEGVAKAFVSHYWTTFDTNRSALAALYNEQSMLTFQNQKFQGQQAILQKLQALPFGECKHRIVSCDAQPSVSGGILVFITGELIAEGENRPLRFSQVFHLAPNEGSFYVTNDMFSLQYG